MVLVTKCYWHPYIHKLNSADKETQFFKKFTLKAISLGIRMCSTRLLLWRNQTCYPMNFYINGTPPLTFSHEYSIFFEQAISQNSAKALVVKGFYLLRMSDGYCFRRAAQGQLSQRNRRNTATVLRAVVKSHNRLKGTKVFPCGRSGTNLKNFSTFAVKSPC